MSEYLNVFKVRDQLDSLRQPSVRDQLLSLKSILSPDQTPYDRLTVIRQGLMSFHYFAVGAGGKQLSPPSCPYLYRISSLTRVQIHTLWKEDRELPLQLAFGELSTRSQNFPSTDGWFPLSDVAEGELTSNRNFTWWSSCPIEKNSVICDLHLRGMPNDWVWQYSLLLRCSTGRLLDMQLLSIPTALDGFDSLIFDATSDLDDSISGTSISIEEPSRLEPGADEFALKPVPVDFIEVLPILVDDSLRAHKIYEKDILGSLEGYYEKGLNLCLSSHT